MALRATDILSLERLKAQLQIPAEATEQDSYLEGLIPAAVSVTQEHTGIPLVRERGRYLLYPRGSCAVVLWARGPLVIDALRWHEPGQTESDEPSGLTESPALRTELAGGWGTRIFPPADRWPERLAGTGVYVDVTRDAGSLVPTAALQACAIAAETLYDEKEFRPRGTFLNLVLAVTGGTDRGDLPVVDLTEPPPPPAQDGVPDGAVTLRGELLTLRGS